MAIAEDEKAIEKANDRSGQWVDITMKKVQLMSMADVPGNIVRALGGRGKKKEIISSKEVVFTKADESPLKTIPEITCDSESESDSSTKQLILTLMEEVKGLKEQIKPPSENSTSVSQTGSSKSAKGKQKTWFGPCKRCGFRNHFLEDFYNKTKKAPKIPKPFTLCKYFGFNDHQSNEYEYYPGCDICGSIAHETTDCTKKTSSINKKPRIANQRSIEPNKNDEMVQESDKDDVLDIREEIDEEIPPIDEEA
ncbi:hypothetical protein Tco_1064240 [Tanacetum coccineum]